MDGGDKGLDAPVREGARSDREAPRVSIAMATYNGAKFVREQMDSFARQTRVPDELVVTDDCSSDDTLKIVQEFGRTAPFPVRLHSNAQRLGYARNFERAISLCAGDFIFLSDQDDSWCPDKIEAVLGEFARHPDAMVIVHDAYLTDERLGWHGQTAFGNVRKAWASDASFAYGCCSAMTAVWRKVALPLPNLGETISHDSWIILMARAFGMSRVLRRPLMHFRRHGSSLTNWSVSDPKGNAASSVLQHVLKPGAADLDQLAALNQAFLHRARAHLHDLPLSEDEAQSVCTALERSTEDIAARISLLSIPRTRRWTRVAGLWASGGYKRASGWKSALKDLVRP